MSQTKWPSMSGRGVLVGLSCLIVLSGLAGCEPNPPISDSPISISVSNGELVVAFCRDVEVVGISAATRTANSDWKDFFRAEGSLKVARGEAFSFDDLASALSPTTIGSPSLAPGTEVDILVLAKDASNNIGGNPEITKELTEGMWLHSSGVLNGERCES